MYINGTNKKKQISSQASPYCQINLVKRGEVTASDNKIKAFTGKQGFGIKDQSQGIQDQGSMGENCVLREWKRDRDQFRSQKMHDTKQPT